MHLQALPTWCAVVLRQRLLELVRVDLLHGVVEGDAQGEWSATCDIYVPTHFVHLVRLHRLELAPDRVGRELLREGWGVGSRFDQQHIGVLLKYLFKGILEGAGFGACRATAGRRRGPGIIVDRAQHAAEERALSEDAEVGCATEDD